MATYTKFNSFVEALAEKKHNLGSDTLKLALTNTAPSASNTVLADITEVSYTGLSTRALTTVSSSQTGGVYILVIDDLVLTTSGTIGPFRYIVVYNDTATNDELIAWYDYGSSVQLDSGSTFTVNFDGTTGLLQLT